VSGGPAIALGNLAAGADTTALGGLNLPIVRLGYQFPWMDADVGLGIFAEPRLGLFFYKPGTDIVTILAPTGTFALQVNIGKYFFFAAGLSVGGTIVGVGSDFTREAVAGGFLLRVGTDLLLERRGGRPSALSLAIEALPLFAHYSIGPIDGTQTFCTIGFSVGYDSY
jgi:hypothetical protein